VSAIFNLGIVAVLGVFVCVAPMVLGWWFAFKPSERLLALMRPLTLAATFSAISNTMLGLVNTLVGISAHPERASSTGLIAANLAESLVVPFLSFACLSVAWLAVAIGMRKQI
jgi:hypothetical protein